MSSTITKKRVNFTIDIKVLDSLNSLVADGDRSDFVNEALQEKITDYGRRKAFEAILESKKSDKIAFSDAQILKIIHEGRREF